jgi:hypothetical protein
VGLLDDAIRSTTDTGGPLTAEDIRRAGEAFKNQSPPPPHRHLLSPKALHTPGTYICRECGLPVEVTIPLNEL